MVHNLLSMHLAIWIRLIRHSCNGIAKHTNGNYSKTPKGSSDNNKCYDWTCIFARLDALGIRREFQMQMEFVFGKCIHIHKLIQKTPIFRLFCLCNRLSMLYAMFKFIPTGWMAENIQSTQISLFHILIIFFDCHVSMRRKIEKRKIDATRDRSDLHILCSQPMCDVRASWPLIYNTHSRKYSIHLFSSIWS